MRTCIYALFAICMLSSYEKAQGEIVFKTLIHSDSEDLNSFEIDSLIFDCIDKADNYFQLFHLDSMKIYLDSAYFYKNQTKSPLTLGYLHVKYGDFFSLKKQDSDAHNYYYKAIDYYKKIERVDLLLPIYHNLAFSYLQKHDTKSLKKIIEKMHSIALEQNEASDYINTYRVISFYFNCLYEKDRKQTVFLDSAIYYDKKVIGIYENTQNLSVRNEDIAYNYLNLASNLLEKELPDESRINSYLQKSEELMNKDDSTMLYNQYWVKGRIAYKQGKYREAEQLFNTQLAIMDSWLQGAPLSMYAELFEMLANVTEIQQKHEVALDYERRRISYLNRIHDAQKYEVIRELETKYEVQQKEQAIIQLTESNKFRQKISYLYLSLLLSGIVAAIFIIHWQKQKKKATDTQLELTRMEKRDAMLQIRLKEEQLKKTELEKYEALLDSHFKNEQISEMDEEMKGIKEEQNQLNVKITEYAEKVKEYENRKSQAIRFATNNTYHTSLLRNIYDLINKRLAAAKEKDEYLESLMQMDDRFFTELISRTFEELSALNIKHCICFYIDMKTEHIAECFSIEPRSVHIVRHRLKGKLKVNKEMDITTFLKQM